MAVCAICYVDAQPRAIGIRGGYGVDFSYQHGLGSNMLDLEVGLAGFNGLQVACTYDWIFPINSWTYAGSWNWYAGVGGAVGFSWYNNWANIGVAGRIGVEYNFDFPLQLSLDWRPVVGPYIGLNGGGAGFNPYGLYEGGIALGIRYKF